ncbi:hypothetical protein TNCV_1701361 [Trichonephila clavipes]|nr:hypothetical protein TNCV_1701361 [Trichonephila clavipes]
MGVISATGGYNFGFFNSLAIEHNELSSVSVDISHKRDKRRLTQSEKKNSIDWRKKRISNRLAKSFKITKNIKKEEKTHMVLIPEGSELANMVANDAKMVAKFAANLVAKNDANLALPPRFRQVLIESPL